MQLTKFGSIAKCWQVGPSVCFSHAKMALANGCLNVTRAVGSQNRCQNCRQPTRKGRLLDQSRRFWYSGIETICVRKDGDGDATLNLVEGLRPSNYGGGAGTSNRPSNNGSGAGTSNRPSNYGSEAGTSNRPSNYGSEAGASNRPSNYGSEAGTSNRPSNYGSEAGTSNRPSNYGSEAGTSNRPSNYGSEAGTSNRPSNYGSGAGTSNRPSNYGSEAGTSNRPSNYGSEAGASNQLINVGGGAGTSNHSPDNADICRRAAQLLLTGLNDSGRANLTTTIGGAGPSNQLVNIGGGAGPSNQLMVIGGSAGPPNRPTDNDEPNFTDLVLLAIDCECVGVGPGGKKDMLARVSIVNADEYPVYNEYVEPTQRIRKYRTVVSGIRPGDLEGGVTFEDAQSEVKKLISGNILIGHQLNKDLSYLRLTHPPKLIRDTTTNYDFLRKGLKDPVTGGPKDRADTPSLKELVHFHLKINIHEPGEEHDSIWDAIYALRIYLKFQEEWEQAISN
ncbi:hypothetical protein GPALN_009724 [Globodera pallida]|nr:hypothetical protein GPALN_009724 [Globodera pallida]